VLGNLRTWLEEIMQGDALEIQQRAQAGRLLGELGDPRPGVTVDDSGRPHIDWVAIPSVKGFMMGSDDEDAMERGKPTHPVDVDSFLISRYPITNAQYRCFIEAGGYKKPQYWQTEAARNWLAGGKVDEKLVETILDKDFRENYRRWQAEDTERCAPYFLHDRKWNNSNHPVVGVSWFEALAFCAWLTEIMGKPVRLPCEEEWEYAARGIKGLQYAWGDEFSKDLGNTENTGLERTSAVGLFHPGQAVGSEPGSEAFGLHDMTGNVWEWTVNRWGGDAGSPQFTYADWGNQSRVEREGVNANKFIVLRGGSWYGPSQFVCCSFRERSIPGNRRNYVGFRVVFSPAAC
ncbi:MAG: formylglycine-generating enzyme family protein, partial [Candidatus Electrothrix sp. AR5]|nr:formylglycine-generating enzyme family protein [Candidatus Electrothrix sp. AR5]